MNAEKKITIGLAEKLADDRAHRIADISAEELIRSNGIPTNGIDEFLFELMEWADDEHLADCIAHLCWRGLAVRHEIEGAVIVQLGDFTIGF